MVYFNLITDMGKFIVEIPDYLFEINKAKFDGATLTITEHTYLSAQKMEPYPPLQTSFTEKCKSFYKKEFEVPCRDRQQILCGEYRPYHREPIYPVNLMRTIPCVGDEVEARAFSRDAEKFIAKKEYAFFPTLELAEEFLLIAKGEWLPKKGDFCVGLRSTIESWSDLGNYRTNREPVFPSVKQRDTFIEWEKRDAKVKEMAKQAEEICRISNELEKIDALAKVLGLSVTYKVIAAS